MPISNTDDIIDSRDVISEIDDLECDISTKLDGITEHQETIDDLECEIDKLETEFSALKTVDQEEHYRFGNNIETLKSDIKDIYSFIDLIENDFIDLSEELKPLKELAAYAENYVPDWNDGATLIHEDYLIEYAQNLIEEIDDLTNIPAYIVIDWEATAGNIKVDYTTVDFDGATYYIR